MQSALPYATLSLNLDAPLLTAALPLLEREAVAAIEWSFDALDRHPELPDWFAELLATYAEAGRLVGHGIFYSVCSAAWTPEQVRWLQNLTRWIGRFPLAHVTEHFGFMTGRDFHHGAPVSPPLSAATLAVGRDRLLRLRHASQTAVGLENLALAYHEDDVRRQGDFLDRLLEPADGFLLLDAHNLYCQAHNFAIDPVELARAYPLERVREVHVSGGSWEPHSNAPGGRVRRDTHDDRVPEAVFGLLKYLLQNCPNLTFVTLEQLGPALRAEPQREQFREDFARMRQLIATYGKAPSGERTFMNTAPLPVAQPLTNEALIREQRCLSNLLESSQDIPELRDRLATSPLANSEWRTEEWSPHMLDTLHRITRKWA